MSTYEGNEAAEITPQEENQLRRVHRLLCDYGAKKKVLKEEGKGGGEIDFVTYLRAVEKTQLATFLQSNYGKALVNKKQGNPERVVGKALMDDLAASDPALAAKLMAGAPNQASHKMRK